MNNKDASKIGDWCIRIVIIVALYAAFCAATDRVGVSEYLPQDAGYYEYFGNPPRTSHARMVDAQREAEAQRRPSGQAQPTLRGGCYYVGPGQIHCPVTQAEGRGSIEYDR